MDAKAILFGLALGDALGAPTEHISLAQIKAEYGTAGIQEPPDPASYTDDTQMTLALIEGLLDTGLDADSDEQMEAVGERFGVWLNSPENNRAPSTANIEGIRNIERGANWRSAGTLISKGCGSAVRVAPIGYIYRNDEAKLREVAATSSLITHKHPTAIAASVAAAYAVKLGIDGVDASEYVRRIMSFTDGMSEDLDSALYRVGHAAAWAEELALRHIGDGWTADETVSLALYCVLKYPNDYAACVRRAANTEGDSDSVACIAGGIMGARLGFEAIPAAWRERCENRDYLLELASRIEIAVAKR